MKLTNVHNIPQVFLDAIKNDSYGKDSKGNAVNLGDLTVTKLISSPRMIRLQELHKDEITEDASDMFFRLWGQAVHHILERAGTGADAIVEQRYSMERQGYIISGQIDRYQGGTLQDFKVVSTACAKMGLKQEYKDQLQVLAALMREAGYEVNKLQLVMILRDWSKAAADRSPESPQAPVIVWDVEMLPEEEVEMYIDQQIRYHQMAKYQLPLCTSLQRWETKPCWKIYKNSNVRATAVFGNWDEAVARYNELATDSNSKYRIESIEPVSKHCEYCNVSRFCEQYNQELVKRQAANK